MSEEGRQLPEGAASGMEPELPGQRAAIETAHGERAYIIECLKELQLEQSRLSAESLDQKDWDSWEVNNDRLVDLAMLLRTYSNPTELHEFYLKDSDFVIRVLWERGVLTPVVMDEGGQFGRVDWETLPMAASELPQPDEATRFEYEGRIYYGRGCLQGFTLAIREKHGVLTNFEDETVTDLGFETLVDIKANFSDIYTLPWSVNRFSRYLYVFHFEGAEVVARVAPYFRNRGLET